MHAIFRLPCIVALGLALTDRLILVLSIALLRPVLAGITLLFGRLLRAARIVTVGITLRSSLANRLALAAFALAFGAAVLVRACVVVLLAAGFATA